MVVSKERFKMVASADGLNRESYSSFEVKDSEQREQQKITQKFSVFLNSIAHYLKYLTNSDYRSAYEQQARKETETTEFIDHVIAILNDLSKFNHVNQIEEIADFVEQYNRNNDFDLNLQLHEYDQNVGILRIVAKHKTYLFLIDAVIDQDSKKLEWEAKRPFSR